MPGQQKRFGNIAVEKGFISSSQLVEALEIQVTEEIENGKRRLIGEILLDLNFNTEEQIKEVFGCVSVGRLSIHPVVD